MWLSEADLVDRFAERLIAEQESDNCIILRELRTGYGIADLALIEVDCDVIDKRRKNISAGIGFSHAAAYAIAGLYEHGELELDALGTLLSMTRQELEKVVEELLARDFVVLQGRMVSLLDPAERMAVRRVITYEAKLTKWKSAIAQAQRHLWFSSQSYVLLPELSPSLYPSVQDACQSFGVGLVQFSEDEAMTTCPVAELPLMGSIPFLWVLSEFLVEVQDWSHLSLRDSQVCPLKRLTSVS